MIFNITNQSKRKKLPRRYLRTRRRLVIISSTATDAHSYQTELLSASSKRSTMTKMNNARTEDARREIQISILSIRTRERTLFFFLYIYVYTCELFRRHPPVCVARACIFRHEGLCFLGFFSTHCAKIIPERQSVVVVVIVTIILLSSFRCCLFFEHLTILIHAYVSRSLPSRYLRLILPSLSVCCHHLILSLYLICVCDRYLSFLHLNVVVRLHTFSLFVVFFT